MKLTEEQLLTTEPYSAILSHLRCGSDYAISVKVLCAKTDLTDRVLRKCVENIRESGVCVISDVRGYYLPANEEELVRYIRRTEKTARSYFYSLRSAKKALRKMQTESQMKLM